MQLPATAAAQTFSMDPARKYVEFNQFAYPSLQALSLVNLATGHGIIQSNGANQPFWSQAALGGPYYFVNFPGYPDDTTVGGVAVAPNRAGLVFFGAQFFEHDPVASLYAGVEAPVTVVCEVAPVVSSGPPAPSFLYTSTFGALASSTLTNTGSTIVEGDIGLYPGTSITGFPPGIYTGTEHLTDGTAHAGETSANAAYVAGQALAGGTVIAGGTIGTGTTLTPGVYKATSSLNLTGGTVTLDGGGNPNAVFIFQIASTLVTASSTQVVLVGGAQPQNVFWFVGSSATLGTGTQMVGTIIANASITDNGGSTIQGRLIALTAAVTLNDTTIIVPGAQAAGGGVGGGTIWAFGDAGTDLLSLSYDGYHGMFTATEVNASGTFTASATATAAAHVVTVVRAAGLLFLRVDGAQVASAAVTSNTELFTTFVVGAENSVGVVSNFFTGALGRLCVYNAGQGNVPADILSVETFMLQELGVIRGPSVGINSGF